METTVENLEQVESELSLHKEYEKVHLTKNEWEIINVIGGKKITAKEIHKEIEISPSTRSTLINKLVKKNLIKIETAYAFDKGRPYHLHCLTVQGANIKIEYVEGETTPSFYIEKEVEELEAEEKYSKETKTRVQPSSLGDVSDCEEVEEVDYVVKQLEWMVINLIGEGKSSLGDISYFFNLGTHKMKALLDDMVAKGLLVENKISASGRGQPALYYFLSVLGKNLFELKNKERPMEPHMERFSKHGSPEHGRLMARTGELLESRGYQVDFDGNKTTFALSNGKSIRFDIRAFKNDGKEELFFETERLRCGRSHIYKKLDKIWNLFNFNKSFDKVIFVFPNLETKRKFHKHMIKWSENNHIYHVNKIGELKGFLTIEYTTFELYKISKIDKIYLKSE